MEFLKISKMIQQVSVALSLLLYTLLPYQQNISSADNPDEPAIIEVLGTVSLVPDYFHFSEVSGLKLELNSELDTKLLLGDFDGDGKSEIVTYKNSDSFAKILSADTKFKEKLNWSMEFPAIKDTHGLMSSPEVSDVSGDGCSDIVFPGNKTSNWMLAVSNCQNGFNLSPIKLFDEEVEIKLYRWEFNQSESVSNLELLDFKNRVYQFTYTPIEGVKYQGKKSRKNSFWRGLPAKKDLIFPPYYVEQILGLGARVRLLEGRNIWASLPNASIWKPGCVADFNGDGREDFLFSGDELYGWWIVLAGKQTGIEVSSTGLISPASSAALVCGDLNGDGKAEVVTLDRLTNSIKVFALDSGAPVAGVLISSSGGENTTSDSRGNFKFSIKNKPTPTLTVKRDGTSFYPAQLELKTNNRKREITYVNFIAEDLEQLNTSGQFVSFTGAETGPYICTGYRPTSSWAKWGDEMGECPKGYAVYAAEGSMIVLVDKIERTKLVASCCRLPFEDILTDESVWAGVSCPPGYVVTGVFDQLETVDPDRRIKCTKINSEKFELGSEHQAVMFGMSSSVTPWKNRIDRKAVPGSIRYGLARATYDLWASKSCISPSPGSLLVGWNPETKFCDNYIFRSLYYKSEETHPSNRLVRMFPDCNTISNPYSATAHCVRDALEPEINLYPRLD